MMYFMEAPEKWHAVADDMLQINGEIEQDESKRNFDPKRKFCEVKKPNPFTTCPYSNDDSG